MLDIDILTVRQCKTQKGEVVIFYSLIIKISIGLFENHKNLFMVAITKYVMIWMKISDLSIFKNPYWNQGKLSNKSYNFFCFYNN